MIKELYASYRGFVRSKKHIHKNSVSLKATSYAKNTFLQTLCNSRCSSFENSFSRMNMKSSCQTAVIILIAHF